MSNAPGNFAKAFDLAMMAAEGKELQICLQGAAQPLHGKVTAWAIPGSALHMAGVYQIVCEAQMGPGAPVIRMPFVFAAESVTWFSTGPVQGEEKPRILYGDS